MYLQICEVHLTRAGFWQAWLDVGEWIEHFAQKKLVRPFDLAAEGDGVALCKLGQACKAALDDEKVKEISGRQKYPIAYQDAAAFKTYVEADYKRVKYLFDRGVYAKARLDQAEAVVATAR
ncbi:MAG: hypothetical protein ABL907_26390, partial [Hyphomicrobium sp.]